MNDEVEVKRAARERLFDAVLADAVAAEAGSEGEVRSARGGRFALAAAVLLATLVTIGVALLQSGDDRVEAQDPEPFDALFPRVEREFHRDRRGLQIRTVAQVRALPDGPLPPVKVLTSDPLGEGPISVEVLEALAGRSGVRSLVVSTHPGLPIEVWRGIAAMPDLEVLHIGCHIDPAGLRELRHAPRLRGVDFGAPKFHIDEDLAAALLELPHVESLSLVWQQIEPATLASFAGLPHLETLYLEACSADPGWVEAIAQIRTLRWLGVARATFSLWDEGALRAHDFRMLAKLPRLQSLALSMVEIAPEDYAALPDSLVMLSLPENVPAAALRELLARPRLRGLSLHGLDDESRELLCDRLPTTQLERIGIRGGMSPAVWRALEQVPRLRHLTFRAGRNVAEDLAHVVEMRQLQHLGIQTSVPPAEQFECLRELPLLARLVIDGVGDGSEYQADLVALQRAVGEDVDLIVR